jgi:hypothetical protein
MTDPRNIAHDKKIQRDKKHRGEELASGAEHVPQPGKKPHIETHEDEAAVEEEAVPEAAKTDSAT